MGKPVVYFEIAGRDGGGAKGVLRQPLQLENCAPCAGGQLLVY